MKRLLACAAVVALMSLVASGGGVLSAEPQTKTNPKDGTKLVLIPEGSFVAGQGNQGNPSFTASLPAYYMAECEVTNAQYAQFLNEKQPKLTDLNKWITRGATCFVRKKEASYEAYGGKENHPIVMVTWYGAAAYAEWAGLRLPTELEWEKAARGADGRTYPWGNKWDATLCRGSANRGTGTTSEVGAYPGGRSPYGLNDMVGNVWEWSADAFQGDLTAPTVGNARALRGGSWYDYEAILRCTARYGFEPSFRDDNVGFRCAASL